jgi:hypothetical protein
MAVSVVDALEVVQVEQDEGDLAFRAEACAEGRLEVLVEGAVVRQAGQQVVTCLGERERKAPCVLERGCGQLRDRQRGGCIAARRGGEEENTEELAVSDARHRESADPLEAGELGRALADEDPLVGRTPDEVRQRIVEGLRRAAGRRGERQRAVRLGEVGRGDGSTGQVGEPGGRDARALDRVERPRELLRELEQRLGAARAGAPRLVGTNNRERRPCCRRGLEIGERGLFGDEVLLFRRDKPILDRKSPRGIPQMSQSAQGTPCRHLLKPAAKPLRGRGLPRPANVQKNPEEGVP